MKEVLVMRILLKMLVAPFALALSLLTALLVFLLDICAFLLTIASVILAVLGITLFFTPTPIVEQHIKLKENARKTSR